MPLLAMNSNANIKLSGWSIVNSEWNEDFIKPIILKCIKLFGINRVMFASDFPVDKLHGTFDKYFNVYLKILQDSQFTQSDIQDMFYFNAIRIYNLNNNKKFNKIQKILNKSSKL